jgi:hypothetical protein
MPVTVLDIGLTLTVVGKGSAMIGKALAKGVQFVSNTF